MDNNGEGSAALAPEPAAGASEEMAHGEGSVESQLSSLLREFAAIKEDTRALKHKIDQMEAPAGPAAAVSLSQLEKVRKP